MNRFCRYQLRTSDVDAARAFYGELLGGAFWDDDVQAARLPPQAASRGAPPHWLGHVGVSNVSGVLQQFVQSGAVKLGPPGPDGTAVVRDPNGAVLAVTPSDAPPPPARVSWHLLSARDEALALALYSTLFGWTPLETYDLGGEGGRHVTFAWDGTARAVGSAANLARLPHVHAQWLFFFPTSGLEQSLDTVRRLGGVGLPPMETPGGDRVAACEDPQGAAFGLYSPRVG